MVFDTDYLRERVAASIREMAIDSEGKSADERVRILSAAMALRDYYNDTISIVERIALYHGAVITTQQGDTCRHTEDCDQGQGDHQQHQASR